MQMPLDTPDAVLELAMPGNDPSDCGQKLVDR